MTVTMSIIWFVVYSTAILVVNWILGAAYGVWLQKRQDKGHIGNLIMAPKDEDGGPYLYLQIEEPVKDWARSEAEVSMTVRIVSPKELEYRKSRK